MITTKDEILSYLSSKKGEFKEDFQVIRLGLFGSYASDNPNVESDIDVLIEFEPNTTNLLEKKAEIRSIIQAKFNRKVDLCREKYIKPYFKSHILNSAIYV